MSSSLPRVGISLNVHGSSPENVLDLVREADKAGIYALGTGDTASDTFAMLNAFATVTRRIRLISTVATWTRTPAHDGTGGPHRGCPERWPVHHGHGKHAGDLQ